MAINVYTGLPGSGKSYEVVSEVIAKQVAAGRRIVTNIDGINPEEVFDYAVDKLGAEVGKLGKIAKVTDVDVQKPDFFPGEDINVASFCNRGDIIVIDEAWRFWGVGEKLLEGHLNFFRMHRHYADPVTHDTCDLVLMTQDIGDLHRSLKRVVEFSVRFKKHKWAGLNKRYVVNTWEGPNQAKQPVTVLQKTYDPAVFPLYNSYSGGRGKEGQVDKRQVGVTWRTKAFLVIFAIGVPGSIFLAFRQAWHLGQPSAPVALSRGASSARLVNTGPVPPPPVPTLPAALQASWQVVPKAPPAPPPPPAFSGDWRLAGFMSLGARRVVILADASGRLRYADPSAFEWDNSRPEVGIVDGSRVSAFSGRLPGVGGGVPAAAPVVPAAVAAAAKGSAL
jgi:zona occludens toxin